MRFESPGVRDWLLSLSRGGYRPFLSLSRGEGVQEVHGQAAEPLRVSRWGKSRPARLRLKTQLMHPTGARCRRTARL